MVVERTDTARGRIAARAGGSATLAVLRDPRRLRTEVFAGMVVALALVPETISFSILAGVGPQIGLVTSFLFAMTIAIVGGRPAMISAAAGSVALVLAPLVREHGVQYLIAAVLLGGVLQLLLSLAGVAKLMRFVPPSVVTGFVNGLAILIFAAQVPHLAGVPWLVYPLTAVGLVIMVVLPRLTRAIPAPLVATTLLTLAAVVFTLNVPAVGDEGRVGAGLPDLLFPDVPLSLATLQIVFPYALGLAMVGLLETFLTQQLVDDITGTPSNMRREGCGQGIANLVTGFFGGMGGCAMIGQTMMNVKECGGRTRVSTFVAGLSLLVLVVFAAPVLAVIPMAALVAVMIMVSFATIPSRRSSSR
ncbi:SulP family inorganic anion transporter [Rhodococcus rhodnii]|uniref:SulP family inorganic anion transporter n=3 Tax=Rhodococcus rhodnii TaxID=38312 RepID=A0A6P2CEF4_9NOCA|nr:SulP family inorganic anion transporter [Rhodococcus rhodnii]